MKKNEHSKIINNIAKEFLLPIGFKRKGQSRMWILDKKWYLVLAEYQPNSYEKGTFLNLYVSFNWITVGQFSFDLGNRISEFIEYDGNNLVFENKIKEITSVVLNKTPEYTKQMRTLSSAKEFIIHYSYEIDGIWENYSKGIICGLNNDISNATYFFNLVLNDTDNIPIIMELKETTKVLLSKINNNDEFKEMVSDIIIKTREKRRLGSVSNMWVE